MARCLYSSDEGLQLVLIITPSGIEHARANPEELWRTSINLLPLRTSQFSTAGTNEEQ